MKTYHDNKQTGERIEIIFNRTKAFYQKSNGLRLFWAYEKGKRKPHGIYGYFSDINKDNLCMLVKEFVGKSTIEAMEEQCVKSVNEFERHQIKKIKERYQQFLNAY